MWLSYEQRAHSKANRWRIWYVLWKNNRFGYSATNLSIYAHVLNWNTAFYKWRITFIVEKIRNILGLIFTIEYLTKMLAADGKLGFIFVTTRAPQTHISWFLQKSLIFLFPRFCSTYWYCRYSTVDRSPCVLLAHQIGRMSHHRVNQSSLCLWITGV